MGSTKVGAPALGWGLIGASDIAQTRMIPAINAQPDSRVVAVMSSQLERARQYAERNSIPSAYGSLEAVLADPQVDVVYISTTNELHEEQTIAAARWAASARRVRPRATPRSPAGRWSPRPSHRESTSPCWGGR